jgi:hypothetical protein
MAREPHQRYQTVEQLARALERFAEGATFSLHPTGRSSRLATGTTPFTSSSTITAPGKRNPLVIAAVVVVLLLGGVGLALLRRPERNVAENVVQPAGPAAPPVQSPAATAAAAPAPVRPSVTARVAMDAGTMAAQPAVKPLQVQPRPAADNESPRVADTKPGRDEVARGHHHAEATEATPASRPARRPPGGRTGELNSNEF